MVRTLCRNCGDPVPRKPNNYCCQQCQFDYQYAEYITAWKQGLEKGYSGRTHLISRHIRRYLFKKYDKKCSSCSWCKTNPITGLVPLEVHHKNGCSNHCSESNLELLCPNCHSLTSTFRNLNKGHSKRIR